MTKFRFLALFAALALLLTVSTTVLAQAPKQPHVFTGEVMVGDEMAMEGTEVTAMIDGETVGMAMVMDGMYVIKLDPGDPTAEGYMDFFGKTVMFMVGMEEVEQSEMWMEGMISSPFNLMAMAMEPEPTMEPVMMPGPRGRDGQPGLPGADGADGADGQDGRQGSQGPKGSTGDDGADGADGNDGAAGRTALTATTVLMALTAPLEPRATQATWEPQDLTAQQALAVRQALTAAAEPWPSSA